MYWHIDDGKRDSAEWMNPEFNGRKTEVNGVECQHSGYLTMYGWIADNGNVKPSQAWVGLYGKIAVRDQDSVSGTMNEKWVLLQLQPWIMGQKCSERQYVSFNIPVRAGLRLKVMTGFPVNGLNGGFAAESTISLKLNQPNTFVGYIVRPQD